MSETAPMMLEVPGLGKDFKPSLPYLHGRKESNQRAGVRDKEDKVAILYSSAGTVEILEKEPGSLQQLFLHERQKAKGSKPKSGLVME